MIKKNNTLLLIFALCIITLCEPLFFDSLYVTKIIFRFFRIVVFFYAGYTALSHFKTWKNGLFYSFAGFALIVIVSTFINGGAIVELMINLISYASMIIIIINTYKKYGLKVISIVAIVFFCFTICQIISRVFELVYYINNIKFYFLGLRTRTTESAFVLLVCSVILSSEKHNKIQISFYWVTIVVALLVNSVSTGILGVILFFLTNAFSKILNSRLSKRVSNLIFIGSLILILLVVVFRVQDYFDGIINILFGKSADLSNRTFIWDNAIQLITASPGRLFFGYGYKKGGEIVPYGGFLWQSHDEYLQLILDGGLIHFASFLIFIGLVLKNTLKCENKDVGKKLFWFVIVYLIMMITEIYTYYPQFYLSMLIIYCYCNNSILRKKGGTYHEQEYLSQSLL